MVHRDKPQINRYLTVFSITTLVFLLGLILGNYVSSLKLDKVESMENDLRTDTMAVEMQYLLLAEDPCRAVNTTPLTNDLQDIASRLDYMENRLGDDNPEVLRLKEYYSLLELRHWLFIRKTNEECFQNQSLVLYFYSNDEDCPSCEEQGFVLTYIRKNYPWVNVYSFDVNIDNPALDTVKDLYGVQSAPTVVIDGKTYDHFIAKDEIESIILGHKQEE